ncbi:MAG: metallophosphoesterase family protein [Clostridia bacterium]|nr:metallophosphoesterase family protein [Clostridia bacterium]
MRILFLGDLHGNMIAAQAMENVIQDVSPDDIWFLGDAVGKGPQSAETCDWVRAHCRHFIGGNWDYGIGGKEFPADAYYWDQLGPERMAWLNSLPREAEMMLSGIRFRLFHGRPVTELLQADSDRRLLEEVFETPKGTFGGAIFADSHRPFFRTLSHGYLMNTGSVGNSMGIPNAHALLVEGTPGEERKSLLCTILCVPYDNQAAAEIARRDPDLPRKEAYIREVLTGIYSR